MLIWFIFPYLYVINEISNQCNSVSLCLNDCGYYCVYSPDTTDFIDFIRVFKSHSNLRAVRVRQSKCTFFSAMQITLLIMTLFLVATLKSNHNERRWSSSMWAINCSKWYRRFDDSLNPESESLISSPRWLLVLILKTGLM